MDPRLKQLEPTWKAATGGGVPSPTDLALINRFALEPLAEGDLYVRTMHLCNDAYDRSGERFPMGYLTRFRDTIPGKSLLPGHDKRAAPLGKFFKADIEGDGAKNHLTTTFYMRRSPENDALRADIDAGILSHASIGFRWADLTCDICQASYYHRQVAEGSEPRYCPHLIGRAYNGVECTATYGGDLKKVEAVEGSLVYLGCQYDSEVFKSALWAPDGTATTNETHPMDPRELDKRFWRSYSVRNTPQEETPVSNEEETAAAAADEKAKRADLVARVAELETELAKVEDLVADGKLYRKDLAEEIERLAGAIDAQSESALILKACKDADCVELVAIKTEFQARFDKAFPPSGKGAPAQPETEEKTETNPRAPHRSRVI